MCGSALLLGLMSDRVIMCSSGGEWCSACVYMSVFPGYICDCSARNTMLDSIVMPKWMCRRLIRERMRESMSE